MNVDLDKLQEAASASARLVFASERELEIDVAERLDWEGASSLSVSVVLPDKAFNRHDLGDRLLELGEAVRSALLGLGEERFPYVDLVATSERESIKA